MPRAKVLQVIPTLSAGGAESVVGHLSVALRTLDVEVKVFLLAGVRGERGAYLEQCLQDAGVVVLGANARNIRSPSNVLHLVRLVRRWRPDIVQASLTSARILCAVVRLLSLDTRSVFVQRLDSTNVLAGRPKWFMRNLDRFYGLTIACSPSVSAAYAELMAGHRMTKLVTIPNGASMLDHEPNLEEKHRARRAVGIETDAFVVAHIGRMVGVRDGRGLASEPKAQDVLLEAFSSAFGGDAQSILVLLGDGPLRADAEALAATLGIDRQTRFLGQQPEPWTALRAADVFCFPSRYEGLPCVLIEAASCGLPVVASDIPEIRVLSVGEAWRLEPVDDVRAFAQALTMIRKQLKGYADKARSVAPHFRERYSMRACAEQHLHAYEAQLGRRD